MHLPQDAMLLRIFIGENDRHQMKPFGPDPPYGWSFTTEMSGASSFFMPCTW
jgi:hypothetical protein